MSTSEFLGEILTFSTMLWLKPNTLIVGGGQFVKMFVEMELLLVWVMKSQKTCTNHDS